MKGLTEREILVIWYVANGHTYEYTAERLGVTKHTIEKIVSNLYSKLYLDKRNQIALVHYAWSNGLA